MKTKITLLACFSLLLLMACQKDQVASSSTPALPDIPYKYDDPLPNGLGMVNWMEDPKFSEKATLGRVLFYDSKLSYNHTVSCGSCHKATEGFADGKKSSTGFMLEETPRNAQHIANLHLSHSFFWDARSQNMEEQVVMPIQNHIEMGIDDLEQVVQRIQAYDYYQDLFTEAYGSPVVNQEKLANALSFFIRSMTSYRSKWDRVQEGSDQFTALEMEGAQVFNEKRCNSCHGGHNFDGWGGDFAVIGLDEDPQDLGVAEWSGNEFDKGKFKVPSLRNVAVTGPYMHDGRFETLDDVVSHYSSGIKPVSNLDWRLFDMESLENISFFGQFDDFISIPNFDPNTMGVADLSMTPHEKEALIAFLNTLTDHEMMRDPRFQDPF